MCPPKPLYQDCDIFGELTNDSVKVFDAIMSVDTMEMNYQKYFPINHEWNYLIEIDGFDDKI